MYAGPSSTRRLRNWTAFSGDAPLVSPTSSSASARSPVRSAKSPSPYLVNRPIVAESRETFRGASSIVRRTEQKRCRGDYILSRHVRPQRLSAGESTEWPRHGDPRAQTLGLRDHLGEHRFL